MSDLLSGGIHFSGIGSGTDFDSMIDQLKKVESIQMSRMTLWRGDWQRRTDGFSTINTEIQKFQTTVQGMDTLSEFMKKTATSSVDSVATATTDSKATEGAYKVEVNQLALNARWTYDSGFSDTDAPVNTSGGDQTFQYTYKGVQRTLTVGNSTSLTGLINLINSDPENKGVKASVIKSGNNYFFNLSGMDMGLDSQLTVDAGTNLSTINASGIWDFRAPQNAQFRINDWPATAYIESTSNTVSEVIEGVTFSLKEKGTTQVSVANDIDKIKANIVAFVDSTNAVRKTILDLTKVDQNAQAVDPAKKTSQFDAEKGSDLTGNYGVQLLSSRLKQATAGRATGFDYYDEKTGKGDYYSTLSQIGILTVADEGDVRNGLLYIDMEKLDEALAKDPTKVAELFAADQMGATNTSNFSYYSSIDNLTKPGIYDVKYDVDASGNIINATIGGNPASVDQTKHHITSLSGDSGGIIVQVNNLVAGSYSDTVRLKQGKAGQMNDVLADMLDSDGTLKIIENNYKEIMRNIDKKIDQESDRLIRWEKTIRLRFARLEATLSTYNSQLTSMTKQFEQLSSGSS